MAYRGIFLFVFCAVGLIVSLVTISHLGFFLSSFTPLQHIAKRGDPFSSLNEDGVFRCLIQDLCLLTIFMLQHSLQKAESIKYWLYLRDLEHVERLMYNLGTCIALQLLMYYWKTIPQVTLWTVSVENPIVWWLFAVVHCGSWLAMYSVILIMDAAEFLGAKQVYYFLNRWPQPKYFKSSSLNRLYSHIRHITFTPLIVVLLIHPVMQLDRLLFGYVIVVYMILRFKVDSFDYDYEERMYRRKMRKLRCELSGTQFIPSPY